MNIAHNNIGDLENSKNMTIKASQYNSSYTFSVLCVELSNESEAHLKF